LRRANERFQSTDAKHNRVEKALRESEEKFPSFVENANDIIFSLTLEGIFTYISPKWTELLGHNASDVIGKISTDFIHPKDLPRLRESFLRVIKTGQKASGVEYWIQHKNGTWQWHIQSSSPIRDAGGKIVGVQGICHDITDRKHAEQALQKTTEEREKLIKELQHALESIKTLQRLIPICAHCKKIIDDKGYWNQVESYISEHTDATFTHGVCPQCTKKLFKEL
jgi:PAS domain S-box-containing protein